MKALAREYTFSLIEFLIIAMFLASCSGFKEGWTYSQYSGKLLDGHSLRDRERLEIEARYDANVAAYIRQHGNPDYFYVHSTEELYFLYLSPQKCVRFRRGAWSPLSKVEELSEVPTELQSGFVASRSSEDVPSVRPSGEIEWASAGTGFAIAPTRVATANHVVRDMSVVQVRFGSGEWTEAKVEKSSLSTDVAVLSLKVPVPKFLKLSVKADPLQGDKVFTMGFPVVDVLGQEPKYTDGVISSLSGLGNDDCLMQITVPVQPGNSGGPLMRDDGTVVGMVTSTAAVIKFFARTGTLPQSVNWAIKSRYLNALTNDSLEDGPIYESRKDLLRAVADSVCQIRAR
jgi:S1-C subfamily serine protease